MSGLFGPKANALRAEEKARANAAAKAAANAAKHAPGMGLEAYQAPVAQHPNLPSRAGFLAAGKAAPNSEEGSATLKGAMNAIGLSALMKKLAGESKGGRRRRHTKRSRSRKTKRSRSRK